MALREKTAPSSMKGIIKALRPPKAISMMPKTMRPVLRSG